MFKVSWATKLPWVELQVGFDGFFHTMKCKICSKIEYKDKLLAPKWDSLHKHANRRKADRPMRGVKKGEWYISNDCKHNKNQVAYANKGRKFIL
jgi:hypothetical protein